TILRKSLYIGKQIVILSRMNNSFKKHLETGVSHLPKIDWYAEVLKRKDDLIRDLQGLVRIRSVYDETTVGEDTPFGEGPKNALDYMLEKGKENGFQVKNVDN